MLDISFFNSYTLYKRLTSQGLKYNEFILLDVEQLLETMTLPNCNTSGQCLQESYMWLHAAHWAYFPRYITHNTIRCFGLFALSFSWKLYFLSGIMFLVPKVSLTNIKNATGCNPSQVPPVSICFVIFMKIIFLLRNNGTGTQSQCNKYQERHWIQSLTSSTCLHFPQFNCVSSILTLSYHLSYLLRGFFTEILVETKMLCSYKFSYFVTERHLLKFWTVCSSLNYFK